MNWQALFMIVTGIPPLVYIAWQVHRGQDAGRWTWGPLVLSVLMFHNHFPWIGWLLIYGTAVIIIMDSEEPL